MCHVAVIGAQTAVQGYGLAGALVRVAEDTDAVRQAWETLPADVSVVVLTRAAKEALSGHLDGATEPMIVVMS